MSDIPKPDLEKIRQSYGSLRRYGRVTQTERVHRIIIAVLAITGLLGWLFLGHLRFLIYVAAVYFAVAVWRGNITFPGRPGGRRSKRHPPGEPEGDDGSDTGDHAATSE